jgi:WD40 repeat protein
MSPATVADYSEDGRRLVTVAADYRVVKLWDPDDGRALATLRGLTRAATRVDCGRDGSRVAAAGIETVGGHLGREIRVWDTVTGQTIAEFHPSVGPTHLIHGAVALSPDGGRLAFDDYTGSPPSEGSGHRAALLRVCALPGGRELVRLPLDDVLVLNIAFSPDGRTIAVSGAGAELGDGVVIWITASGSVHRLSGAWSTVLQLAFSPDGRRLADVDREKLRLWDARSEQELLTLQIDARQSYDVGFNPTLALSPDGRLVASTNWDGSISVWDGSPDRPAPDELASQARAHRFAWHLREADLAVEDGDASTVASHLDRLREIEPPDAAGRAGRAHLAMRSGDWRSAADDYAAWLDSGELDPGHAWLGGARALLMVGDREGYRRLCTSLLARRAQDPGRIQDPLAARALTLAPGGASDADQLIGIAERGLADWQGNPWAELTLGLAHYRAGHWEQALACARKSMERDPARAWTCWPLLAMASDRLGHHEAARRWLEQAAAHLDRAARQRAAGTSAPLFEDDWPDFQIPYAEARDVSEGQGESRAPERKAGEVGRSDDPPLRERRRSMDRAPAPPKISESRPAI